MNVLFVDDDEAILEVYRQEVEAHFENITPLLALNGLEALEVIEKEDVSLVLTDGNMPKMDGLLLAKNIKDKKLEIDVIMITGFHKKVDLMKKEELGIKQVLEKPVDFDELLKIISSYL